MAGSHKKQYWIIFVALAVLTALEVGIVYLPVGKVSMVTALCLLAVTKAALVGLFYMHLAHETSILKLTVAIPLGVPVIYAFVLIAEAAWRLI